MASWQAALWEQRSGWLRKEIQRAELLANGGNLFGKQLPSITIVVSAAWVSKRRQAIGQTERNYLHTIL